jgi:hypothetical protein
MPYGIVTTLEKLIETTMSRFWKSTVPELGEEQANK